MAEREGFEPPCRLPGKTLSRRPRYDHFGTSPFFGARSRRFAAVPSGCSLGLTSLRSRFRRSLRSVRLRPLALVLALAAAASRRFPPAARLGSLRYARAFDARSAPFASGRWRSFWRSQPPLRGGSLRLLAWAHFATLALSTLAPLRSPPAAGARFGARSRRFAAVPSGCSLGLTSLRSRFRRSLRSVRLRPLALVLALAAAASRRFPPAARLGSLRYARAFDARS